MERDRERIFQLEQNVQKLESLLKQRESEITKLQNRLHESSEKLLALREENRNNLSKALQRDALDEHVRELRDKYKQAQEARELAMKQITEMETSSLEAKQQVAEMRRELDETQSTLADVREQLR